MGRHQFRYWNGGAWTEHVADAGMQSTDPLNAPAVQRQTKVTPGYTSAPAPKAAAPRFVGWIVVGAVLLLVGVAVVASVTEGKRETATSPEQAAENAGIATQQANLAKVSDCTESFTSFVDDEAVKGVTDDQVLRDAMLRWGLDSWEFQVFRDGWLQFLGNAYRKGAAAAQLDMVESVSQACAKKLGVTVNGNPLPAATNPLADQDQSDPSETSSEDPPATADQNGDGMNGDPGSLPDGLFCRDLKAKGLTYADAVAYYVAQGRPDRMDIDINGIPCETVYSPAEVRSYIAAHGKP